MPNVLGLPGTAALSLRWTEPEADDLAPHRVELRRLAAAMRSIIDSLTATAAPSEVIEAAADGLVQLAETFASLHYGTVYDGFAEAANAGADPHASFEHSPFIGLANPLAPPIRLREVDGEIHGWVTFGSAYEGPPGCVHGGFIAGSFDEVLGAAQTLSGNPGMTGTLTVRYRSPTPLHAPLHFVARLDRVEGRKIFAVAQLWHGETLCAEADAVFISIDFGRFAHLKEAREAAERARLARS
ncbi:MAG: PaaI family thioesterase [Acidimicrobiales bacterium]|nr:PaaI family thioesterase [Acidimicrobiales bacterium]